MSALREAEAKTGVVFKLRRGVNTALTAGGHARAPTSDD